MTFSVLGGVPGLLLSAPRHPKCSPRPRPRALPVQAHYPDHDYRDLNRFLIYKKKLKPALETYAKYYTWRETNLPIDPASCQTELDRGLMVPHGVDVEGRKVLWFLAAKQAKGVWDLDEVIRAFVHQVRSTSCIDVSSGSRGYRRESLASDRGSLASGRR